MRSGGFLVQQTPDKGQSPPLFHYDQFAFLAHPQDTSKFLTAKLQNSRCIPTPKTPPPIPRHTPTPPTRRGHETAVYNRNQSHMSSIGGILHCNSVTCPCRYCTGMGKNSASLTILFAVALCEIRLQITHRPKVLSQLFPGKFCHSLAGDPS